MIRRYGILNDQIGRGGAFLEGIPFPGAYVTNEAGVVIAKFFHDTYKKRDSPENLLDAAAGTIQINGNEPNVRNSDPELPVSVFVRGGRGTIRQGIIRHLVVRFELPDGLHIYGEPVPDGMVPTTVNVSKAPISSFAFGADESTSSPPFMRSARWQVKLAPSTTTQRTSTSNLSTRLAMIPSASHPKLTRSRYD